MQLLAAKIQMIYNGYFQTCATYFLSLLCDLCALKEKVSRSVVALHYYRICNPYGATRYYLFFRPNTYALLFGMVMTFMAKHMQRR